MMRTLTRWHAPFTMALLHADANLVLLPVPCNKEQLQRG